MAEARLYGVIAASSLLVGAVAGLRLPISDRAPVLVMLTDAMIPEAVGKGGKAVGLVTCLGFALAVLIDLL